MARFFFKSTSVVLFIVTVVLIVYSTEISFWINSRLASEKSIANNRVNIHLPTYVYGRDSPFLLGNIENTNNAYFRIKLRFRVDDTEGYPNIFQSAPYNRGLRVEIAGSTVAIIVQDLQAPNGLRGMTLTSALEKSRWYVLEVEAMNGAFVRATLDGVSVANYSGDGLNIEMSEFILGAGFDDSRVFKGEIDSSSLVKGNIAFPRLSLAIIYSTIIFAFLLFMVVLWKALSEYYEVRLVVFKLVFISLPLLLVIVYIEYKMSYLNTDYYTRRVALEQEAEKVEVLVVGSSNTFYGVTPEVFSLKGFNLAFPGSGMYFDAKLAEKYSGIMPNLKMVVLTVNYFTFGLDYSTFSQSWRQFALRQNFGISLKTTVGLPFNWQFWLEPRNFSKIALYGKALIGEELLAPVDVVASCLGWFNGGDVAPDLSKNLGLAAAKDHNSTTDSDNYIHNLSDWDTLVSFLRGHNINVVMATLPTDASYYQELDKDKKNKMHDILLDFSARNNIKFVDFTGDGRFSSDDFTWEMPDHLNAKGATKFSKILDEELIVPHFK